MARSTEADRYDAFVRISAQPPGQWLDAVARTFPEDAAAREEVLAVLDDSVHGEEIQLLGGYVRYAAGTCLGLLLRLRHSVH